jgi:hypothetical protein
MLLNRVQNIPNFESSKNNIFFTCASRFFDFAVGAPTVFQKFSICPTQARSKAL